MVVELKYIYIYIAWSLLGHNMPNYNKHNRMKVKFGLYILKIKKLFFYIMSQEYSGIKILQGRYSSLEAYECLTRDLLLKYQPLIQVKDMHWE